MTTVNGYAGWGLTSCQQGLNSDDFEYPRMLKQEIALSLDWDINLRCSGFDEPLVIRGYDRVEELFGWMSEPLSTNPYTISNLDPLEFKRSTGYWGLVQTVLVGQHQESWVSGVMNKPLYGGRLEEAVEIYGDNIVVFPIGNLSLSLDIY